MIAHLRKTRISPKKANLVAGMVRNMPVDEALAVLKHTPKKGAKILYKVIQSARSNAENNFKQDPETLIIKEIIVTQGPTNKRWQPVSRGRAHPILKRTSHITVKVEANSEITATKPVKKTTATKEKALKAKKEELDAKETEIEAKEKEMAAKEAEVAAKEKEIDKDSK
ncbi:MAG: 50S ribosomal protein L22 [Candidatus Peregrinibacteria bacterium]|nr:50S ribosomal protein L22 [Candidatus Peregrinibacteria bacterium]